ncbi:uncharacterized protein LOC124136740 [Haliotis rufescens]|uniref:uncharacterized protein LOC124136740 n=1 Tax=Haliotis rufescens TaxID=6454 RepID=UPI00201E99E4|nr:uncharacterized protein LOC124136740 [Haliotis rufescens]
MASSTNASVKPGSFVLMVVILTNARHTHCTTSNTPTDNLTFESSCAARSWSAAVTDCINKGAAIFTIEDLRTAIGGPVLKKAENEHTKIWIHNNGTCWAAFNDTFQAAVCSDTNYYVCTSRTSTSSNWYVHCPNRYTDTPTQGSTGSTVSSGSAGSTVSTSRNHTTSPEAYTTVTIITTVTCVIVALVAVLIITVCYIINRKKKPIKYAVRAESAMYHRQHPDPGKVEEPQLADVQLICPTEADGGNSGMNVSL